MVLWFFCLCVFFFFNDTATTEIYTLSLHDALPISEYLRHFFLNNDLAEGRYVVGDRPVSLRDIHRPIFAVGTIMDHVAPWRSVYKIQMLTHADVTFVLSNGGHNAGIVNPPSHPHRHHQIATHKETETYIDPDSWQKAAVHHNGSWWPCWRDWLLRQTSEQKRPPPTGGVRKNPGQPPTN